MKVNRVSLLGRLTKDIEIKKYNDTTVANIGIAISNGKDKNGEEIPADFINLKAFNKTAETMNQYLSKGRKVYIDAHLKSSSYDDKEGKKKYSMDVIVDGFEFCDSKEEPNKETKSDPFKEFSVENKTTEDEDLPF